MQVNLFKQIFFEKKLKEQIKWLIKLRWIAIILIFLIIIISKHILNIGLILFPLFLGNIIILIYNFIFILLYKKLEFQEKKKSWYKRATIFSNIQISVDLFMLSYFIYFTGGIENPFVFYFIFHMVVASIILSNKAAYIQATFAIGLLGIILSGTYSGVLPHYHLHGFIPDNFCLINPFYSFGVFLIFSTTLYITVYMTTTIVNRLKEGEKELEIVNKKLEEQDILKSKYVQTVSHDLQSSISAIQSCLNVVINDFTGTTSEKSKEMIARAEKRTRYLLYFVKDLLNLSRLRASKELVKKTVKINDIIKKIVEQLSIEIEKKELNLYLENLDNDCIAFVNPDAIEQLFLNLITNAIKYTEKNGDIIISFDQKTQEGFVQLSIKDTGIGIPGEELSHIYEDFYRGKNAELIEKNGTGLGLSIVKQIIDTHKGKIWVETQEGKGSKFTLILPAEEKKNG